MITILFMVSLALLMSIGFVASYLWASSAGQFDDLETPALRILKDDLVLQKDERKKNEPTIR